MKQLLLAYYGDDFTGSTDALEFLVRAGAKAMLFIDPPSAAQLQAYPDLDAYGVAGYTRSLAPADMEKVLLPAFEKLKSTGAKHVHYKVCSTFDSSPTIGSIGRALDIGIAIFQNKTTAILGGMPALGRFCAFGNLFAKMGIGSTGKVYRLDRHPSMSKHPVTPMHESDLRLHLAKQTEQAIGLIDIIELKRHVRDWHINEPVILVDALSEAHLEKIGEWLSYLQNGSSLFSVGSSGIEMALGKYWNKQNLLTPVTQWPHPGRATPLLIVSGSCSPVTAAQIMYVRSMGFEEVIVDAISICNDDFDAEAVSNKVNELLALKKNVIVHTGDKQPASLSSLKLGTALGTIAKIAAGNDLVTRVVVAGGDTSSYAARAMDIEAVEMLAPIVIGAPLCKAISKNKKVNGLEVNFKGGQVGSENYFEVLMHGALN